MALADIIRKCRLAATLNASTTFNITGSKALADVIEHMANALDKGNAA